MCVFELVEHLRVIGFRCESSDGSNDHLPVEFIQEEEHQRKQEEHLRKEFVSFKWRPLPLPHLQDPLRGPLNYVLQLLPTNGTGAEEVHKVSFSCIAFSVCFGKRVVAELGIF